MTELEKKDIISRVDQAVDLVRPHLITDGGNVEIIDLTPENDIVVRWVGNCESCSMSIMTLKAGLQEAIRAKVPEIRYVLAQNGLNPSELLS